MGYYTNFSFTLEEGPKEQYEKMLKDIDDIIGNDETSSFESVNAKWYDYDKDIKQLSERYPGIAFRVYGDGEESDDLWQEYWRAGKCFREQVQFATYDEIKDKLN